MFGFFKPKSYLGVDIGAGGIKLVELRLEKKRPVLFTYSFTSDKMDIHKFPTSEEKNIANLLNQENKPAASNAAAAEAASEAQIQKYADTLKVLCKTARTVSKTAMVSLPVSSVFHAVVTLPPLKKEELDHAVKAEVKKLLPIPLEEVALDFQVIKTAMPEKNQRVLVNAVPHKLIDFYTKVFAQAGLSLEALEPESTALTRCLVGRDQSVSMIIDLGSERTSFFIVDQGVPITHHSIDAGGDKIDRIMQNILGVDHELLEQVKHDVFDFLPTNSNSVLSSQKWLDIFALVIDPILKEIEVSLEVYLRQTGNEGKRPERIILTGGMALMPFLSKHIQEMFKIKCYVGDAWARVVYQDGLKSVLRQIGPRMSVAVGLAMRDIV